MYICPTWLYGHNKHEIFFSAFLLCLGHGLFCVRELQIYTRSFERLTKCKSERRKASKKVRGRQSLIAEQFEERLRRPRIRDTRSEQKEGKRKLNVLCTPYKISESHEPGIDKKLCVYISPRGCRCMVHNMHTIFFA